MDSHSKPGEQKDPAVVGREEALKKQLRALYDESLRLIELLELYAGDERKTSPYRAQWLFMDKQFESVIEQHAKRDLPLDTKAYDHFLKDLREKVDAESEEKFVLFFSLLVKTVSYKVRLVSYHNREYENRMQIITPMIQEKNLLALYKYYKDKMRLTQGYGMDLSRERKETERSHPGFNEQVDKSAAAVAKLIIQLRDSTPAAAGECHMQTELMKTYIQGTDMLVVTFLQEQARELQARIKELKPAPAAKERKGLLSRLSSQFGSKKKPEQKGQEDSGQEMRAVKIHVADSTTPPVSPSPTKKT